MKFRSGESRKLRAAVLSWAGAEPGVQRTHATGQSNNNRRRTTGATGTKGPDDMVIPSSGSTSRMISRPPRPHKDRRPADAPPRSVLSAAADGGFGLAGGG